MGPGFRELRSTAAASCRQIPTTATTAQCHLVDSLFCQRALQTFSFFNHHISLNIIKKQHLLNAWQNGNRQNSKLTKRHCHFQHLESFGVAADDHPDFLQHVGVGIVLEQMPDFHKQPGLHAGMQDRVERLHQLEGMLQPDHVIDLVLDVGKRFLEKIERKTQTAPQYSELWHRVHLWHSE